MSDGRVAIEVDAVWPEEAEEDEGVVVDWYVREGAEVEEGETICTVQIEKISVDVPAPAAGTLAEVSLAEDETFGRGDALGYIETGG